MHFFSSNNQHFFSPESSALHVYINQSLSSPVSHCHTTKCPLYLIKKEINRILMNFISLVLWVRCAKQLKIILLLFYVFIYFCQLGICLISSVATIAISLVAGVIYIVDLDRNLVAPCGKTMYSTCTDQHYVTVGVSRSALSDETWRYFARMHAQTCQLNAEKSYKLIKHATKTTEIFLLADVV